MHRTYTQRLMMALVSMFLLTLSAFAADAASLRGAVVDALGAVVPNARVNVLAGKKNVAAATTDAQGQFTIALPAAGRYTVTAEATGFQSASLSNYFSTGSNRVELTLAPASVEQKVSVTSTAQPLPIAQVGSPVAIIDRSQLAIGSQIDQPLREQPGLQVTQTGAQGGLGVLYIRGGNDSATKVLIDGVPANVIGGKFDLSTLTTTGVGEIEVLRAPNSALYGSDALAGVVSVSTRHGETTLPTIEIASQGGNFGTRRGDASLGGVYKQFDYFNEYENLVTNGNTKNNSYRFGSYAGSYGWQPDAKTSIRLTARQFGSRYGSPNAKLLYGIANPDWQDYSADQLSLSINHKTTDRWTNLVRYGRARSENLYREPYVAGESDGWGDYLGSAVTINGANGYSVRGRAILGYAGTYPSLSRSTTNRDFAYAQSSYRLNNDAQLLGSFNYESERGLSFYTGGVPSAISRGNYNYAEQLSGDVRNRLYYTLGVGVDYSSLFKTAVSPRFSLAYHLVRPNNGWLSMAKLRAGFNKGIKEPAINEESSSLYNILKSLGRDTQGVDKIGPERVRSYDAGLELGLFSRATVNVSYFHNMFYATPQYVNSAALVKLGYFTPTSIPSGLYGAYVNTMDFRAQGVELDGAYRLGHGFSLRGGYTRLNSLVLRAPGTAPVYNPLFPTVAIGAYSALVGSRPFHQAPNSGFVAAQYSRGRLFLSMTGTFVGRRDDSTFLTDQYYGNTMLLPNKNLDAAYQRVDLGYSFRLSRRLSLFGDVQNLFSQHYSETFGYPALPFTFRSGVKYSFGGSDWKF